MQVERTSFVARRPGVALLALVAAIIVGFALGAWLGTMAPSGQAPVGAIPSSSPSATGSSTPTMSAVATSIAPPTPSPSGEVLLSQSGSGDFTSEDFEAIKGWQVQWTTAADPFSLSIRGDRDLGTISDHPGPASGVVSPPVTGTFRVEIKATGSWTLTVLQGAG